MLTLIDYICLQCADTFRVQKGSAHSGKYCSRRCRDAAASRKIDVSCARCGAGLRLPPSHVRPRNYCSAACRKLGTSVALPCEVCRSDFTVMQGRASTARFCSVRCKDVGLNQGKRSADKRARQTAEYRAWRTAVFVRDDFTCRSCGLRGGALNADHIKPFATHPELRLDLDNGRTLCVPCHRQTPTWGRKKTA